MNQKSRNNRVSNSTRASFSAKNVLPETGFISKPGSSYSRCLHECVLSDCFTRASAEQICRAELSLVASHILGLQSRLEWLPRDGDNGSCQLRCFKNLQK